MKLSEIQKLVEALPQSQSPIPPEKIQLALLQLGFTPGNFYQELEMDSLYVDTHQDITHSNSNIQLHSHNFYELICCRNNCGAEYIIGADRYKLQKGDIIYVPPGFSHRPLLPETVIQPYIRDVLWISESYMNFVCEMFLGVSIDKFSKPGLLRTAGTQWEYICDFFRTGIRESETRQSCWEALVCSNAITILGHLCRTNADIHTQPLRAEKPDLTDQVMAFVEQHLSEKITLAEVSRQFFVSDSTISQTFRKKLGVSFYRCVTQRRLIAAKALIEQGLSMDSVAEAVGFSDYSSFFRAFKQEYGISPRAYRKLHNNG